jgi:hypothetical protein
MRDPGKPFKSKDFPAASRPQGRYLASMFYLLDVPLIVTFSILTLGRVHGTGIY